MTWTETHRRWQALRTIEEQLATATKPELPWNDELALVFGDRASLLAALRYRLRLAVNTQMDTHLPEAVLEEQRAHLVARTQGVLRLLQAEDHAASMQADQMTGQRTGQRTGRLDDETWGTTRVVA
ncbi:MULTISPECIES: hypothetical protein [unclassified Nocardioides]|uniref:hypothetical protein n=1 Tax=unclassified Nocardioides TaxID=2615069 RepID=UPI0012E3C0AB|nr:MULTISPECIES: hypothetical protein [unclassified Nocardioides]